MWEGIIIFLSYILFVYFSPKKSLLFGRGKMVLKSIV